MALTDKQRTRLDIDCLALDRNLWKDRAINAEARVAVLENALHQLREGAITQTQALALAFRDTES